MEYMSDKDIRREPEEAAWEKVLRQRARQMEMHKGHQPSSSEHSALVDLINCGLKIFRGKFYLFVSF